jgi:hypothetical protein
MVRGIERSEAFRSDTDREHFVERLGEILHKRVRLAENLKT